MKHLLLFGLFTFLSISLMHAQGIEFFHGSWEEALTEAKEQEKVIFIDAFATWCGPCKRMARDVFPDEKVGSFYNRYFINLKLDMEKGEGLEFRKEYPVSAFPTLFFINGDGEVIQKVKGAKDVNGFLDLGQKVLGLADNSKEYAERYEDGERDPEFILKYVKSLNNSGQSSSKVANEYLNSQEQLNTPFNLAFILEATTSIDSKAFSLLEKYYNDIEAVVGADELVSRVEMACMATAKRANEFNSMDLLNEAQDKMSKYSPEKGAEFVYTSAIGFHLAQHNPADYAKVCRKYAKKVLKGEASKLNDLANTMYKNFQEEAAVLKEAEALAGQAAKQSQNYQYYVTYASILKDNNKQKEAEAAAEKALELASQEGPHRVKMLEAFVRKIKG
jgi:thiol-disulfide isomerase/thioredoxin